eukprot:3574334-Rhodomonas_salina.1
MNVGRGLRWALVSTREGLYGESFVRCASIAYDVPITSISTIGHRVLLPTCYNSRNCGRRAGKDTLFRQ